MATKEEIINATVINTGGGIVVLNGYRVNNRKGLYHEVQSRKI